MTLSPSQSVPHNGARGWLALTQHGKRFSNNLTHQCFGYGLRLRRWFRAPARLQRSACLQTTSTRDRR